jgi:hypothetical protein
MLPQMEHSVKRIPPNAHSLGRYVQQQKKKKEIEQLIKK